jgi:hypothetical protein
MVRTWKLLRLTVLKTALGRLRPPKEMENSLLDTVALPAMEILRVCRDRLLEVLLFFDFHRQAIFFLFLRLRRQGKYLGRRCSGPHSLLGTRLRSSSRSCEPSGELRIRCAADDC